jgi:hypothetical protein
MPLSSESLHSSPDDFYIYPHTTALNLTGECNVECSYIIYLQNDILLRMTDVFQSCQVFNHENRVNQGVFQKSEYVFLGP